MRLYTPCWVTILCFIVREPRKLIHPVLKPLFEKWKEHFHANPGAIDLLDLSDSASHTDEEKKYICRNPALDHYICKHGIWKDVDIGITSSNPARGITEMVLPLMTQVESHVTPEKSSVESHVMTCSQMIHSLIGKVCSHRSDAQSTGPHVSTSVTPYRWRYSGNSDPHETSIFTNPSPAWVDKIFEDGKFDLKIYPAILANPNPRVVRRIFEELPNLSVDSYVREHYNILSREGWLNLFLNTHPQILSILEHVANKCGSVVGVYHNFFALSSSLPRNPPATRIYLEWCDANNLGIEIDTLTSNSHPHIVDFIVKSMLSNSGTKWIEDTRFISRNVGIFVPDIPTWKLVVHKLAATLK